MYSMYIHIPALLIQPYIIKQQLAVVVVITVIILGNTGIIGGTLLCACAGHSRLPPK